MIQWLLKKVIGSKNARMLKALRPTVDRINQLEIEFQRLSDDELRAKVEGWKTKLRAEPQHALKQRMLDELLPEAFAAVKNTARRLTERKHTFIACDMIMQAQCDASYKGRTKGRSTQGSIIYLGDSVAVTHCNM